MWHGSNASISQKENSCARHIKGLQKSHQKPVAKLGTEPVLKSQSRSSLSAPKEDVHIVCRLIEALQGKRSVPYCMPLIRGVSEDLHYPMCHWRHL